MLQADTPDDYVIATGQQHTVRDFAEKAFACNGIKIRWQGKGVDEIGIDEKTGKTLVCINPAFYRPTDVDNLLGDPSKAKENLGWDPQQTPYEDLVRLMAEHDIEVVKKEEIILKGNK